LGKSAVERAVVIRGVQLAARAATAAALSIAAANAMALPFPIYAMIAAVIVTDRSPLQTRRLSVPRIVGTAIGMTIGATLSAVLGANAAATGVGIFIAALISVLVLPDAAKLSGYGCAIVLLGYRDNPWIYAWYRLLETLLGIGMALLVSMVPLILRDDDAAVSYGCCPPRSGASIIDR
jgi:uncharacterized membrane protein YgaE (UPF0421/DUF939 family)